MKKYILLKGYEGFGDRLENLLQTISYCRKTNRVLVVDWSDYMWTNDLNYGFDH